jgi:hypothetical protein
MPDRTSSPDPAAQSASDRPGKAEQTGPRRSATPERPDLLQLDFHVVGRFRLPVGCRFGLGLALYPRGACSPPSPRPRSARCMPAKCAWTGSR